MRRIFKEIRRRKVIQVGGVYAATAWILMQGLVIVLATYSAPAWVQPTLIAILISGFPVAIVLAWAFELTPEGMNRTKSLDDVETDQKTNNAVEGKTESRNIRPSVAVLPFANLSRLDDDEVFADGIAEDIITLLSQHPQLLVIARNSSFSWKGQSPDIRIVGRELDVVYVVEGSVRRLGENLRVTVQLIDAAANVQIWSSKYDEELANMFQLQDQISSDIVTALGAEVMSDVRQKVQRQEISSMDAWGMMHEANATPYSEETLLQIKKVLELEPDYALAHAEYAENLLLQAVIGHGTIDDDVAATAQKHYDNAFRLAPHDPEVQCILASVAARLGRHDQEQSLAEQAFNRSPNFYRAAMAIGQSLMRRGKVAEGRRHLENAIRLAPKGPLLEVNYLLMAMAWCLDGDYEEAEKWCRRALQTNAAMADIHGLLANILGAQDKTDLAGNEWQAYLRANSSGTVASLADRFARDYPNATHHRLTDGLSSIADNSSSLD
jgi:TolB-like protein/Tfp pilus assembly protein PilF